MSPVSTVPVSFATSDPELQQAYEALMLLTAHDPAGFFAPLIRRSIDEVLDGPRTGRYQVAALEKTEKTYVGTKVEIVVRDALQVPKGQVLDIQLGGVEVDVKWSQENSWMIPKEYLDPARNPLPPVCLMIGTRRADGLLFDLVLARPINVTTSSNRDQKFSINLPRLRQQAAGSAAFLVDGGTLEANFLSTLTPDAVARIMGVPKGQARVNQLFLETLRHPVPRAAIEVMAQQKDPLRRTRQDASRTVPFKILSSTWQAHRDAAAALGIPGFDQKDLLLALPPSELLTLSQELQDAIAARKGQE